MAENIKKTIEIPTIPITYPRVKRDYPIPERENFLRALRHEKPLWMPNIISDSQSSPTLGYGDIAETEFEDSSDWFGLKYKFSAAQGTNTPEGGIFSVVTEWREKIPWPDFEAWDWHRGAGTFVRDEDLALFIRVSYGNFEKLHAFEGFEQALMDLILEPEECRAFFERMTDHKIEVVKRLNDIYHYDYIIYHDDWGTARAPFFSTELFEQTLLEPSKRFVDAIQKEGIPVMFHNCGLINDFIPYLVNDIKASAVQIQTINDIPAILKNYGEKVTVNFRPDPELLYDPETTPEEARAYAREIVDTYGAHVNPGAGAIISSCALNEDVFRAFEDEIYRYSREKYKAL